MFEKITGKKIELFLGAICVSVGYAISIPFLIAQTLGGAGSTFGSLVLGILLLAAGREGNRSEGAEAKGVKVFTDLNELINYLKGI